MTLRKTNPIQRRKKRTEDGNSVMNYCLICLGLSYISFVSFEIQTTDQSRKLRVYAQWWSSRVSECAGSRCHGEFSCV